MKKESDLPNEKNELHPRSKHKLRYNFSHLIRAHHPLKEFVRINEYNDESINFFNPPSVLALNTALLKSFYSIQYWDIPHNYLCPPIPGRADYIHYAADLLSESNKGNIPTGDSVRVLDIGTGANCIYPIIGCAEYGWNFVGTDINDLAIQAAKEIVNQNPSLAGKVEIRLQKNKKEIFKTITKKEERFDLVVCNPPFHESPEDVKAASLRKLSNLKKRSITKVNSNFGGVNDELWCDGGEKEFIRLLIEESLDIKNQCLWFTCLISRQEHLEVIYKMLYNAKAIEVKTISMGQGNKRSRIIAWTFLNQQEQETWWNKI